MKNPTHEDAKKPQSMPSGPRNVLRSNDSASLWNCTLSPGWSREESDILRKALMKFGIGNWAKIIDSQCLPGKTNAQMNLQLQRMLGQQSTAGIYKSLYIKHSEVKKKNSKIQGPDIKRKNNCIVNTGEEEWSKIELPRPEDPQSVLESKHEELRRLQQELENVQSQISNIRRKKRGESLETIESSSSKEIAKIDNGKQQKSTRKNKRTKQK
ncbi:7290_t:CDS:2 [Diversispora eburnea]|uniref:7290_t:CDS:1 n=1 Tax=Diversispora eburnea TaxID=1213867 RepID=A0A9N9EY41_9GLOM|nr:7290_t:CDS:2 [Diversispora eburnea]